MNKVSFALVIHSHQPVGNFDHVIEAAYQKAYLPFVQALFLHPRIRLSLHYSGVLLEWLHAHHREFFRQLRRLADRGQAELVGGGYYEPILPAIPDADKVAQIHKLADFLEHHFGSRPQGAWLAERVWEPGLARPLAEAGVEYTVLDDTHFLAAGLEPAELRGAFITEEAGFPLRLVPSLKELRYAIPFREPEETLRILGSEREGSGRSKLFAMGDDCEKFGVWPGTFDHCYKDRWLEKFLLALESAEDWLETTTVSDFLARHAPVGRTYLPAASYEEMMEWALPVGATRDFRKCLEECPGMASGARFRRFLRGGLWRSFLGKYAESNQIHKLMLEVSRRGQDANRRAARAGPAGLFAEAQTHLLAAQCNDAYWHGVFGGLYAPHLRSALLRNLIQAEAALDKLEGLTDESSPRLLKRDFDVDGHEEILVEHSAFGMVIRPADGGTVSSWRFKPAGAELINSLMRRPEVYHDLVRQHISTRVAPKEGPASIHDRVLSKESNLPALLRYDRYSRQTFRTYVFSNERTWEDFDYLRLGENRDVAGGPWELVRSQDTPALAVELDCHARHEANGESLPVHARKTITTQFARRAWRLECHSSLSIGGAATAPLALGVEVVLNLLAPDAPDRYFLANEVRQPLEFKGEIRAPRLHIVDEWQRVKISLDADPQPRWWVVPIETISRSESGFERIYQGSAILAVWKVDSLPGSDRTSTLRAEISHLGAAVEPGPASEKPATK